MNTLLLSLILAVAAETEGQTLEEIPLVDASGVIDVLAGNGPAEPLAALPAAEAPPPTSFLAACEAVRQLDATRRGRVAPASRVFRSLGAAAVPLLIARLRLAPPCPLNPSARLAWRVGMIEALGDHKDPRAAAALEAMLTDPRQPVRITRAAAEAVGLMNDGRASRVLLHELYSSTRGARRRAILAGMGSCRRLEIAQALAAELRSCDSLTAQVVVRALGELGNAWAWATLPSDVRRSEQTVRGYAARALVSIFAQEHHAMRGAIVRALRVINAPGTTALLERAGESAPLALRSDFQAAADAVSGSPVR
jgi:HEAT repeat protein